MNNVQTLLIVLAVIAGAGVVLAIILPYFKKRGVDMEAVLDRTKEAIATVNSTLETLRPFLPESPCVDAIDKIMAAAHIGVGNAEQLCLIGQLEPDKRKEAARQYIMDAVKLAGVEVTPEVDKLIDGAIEAKVLELGHLEKPGLPIPQTSAE